MHVTRHLLCPALAALAVAVSAAPAGAAPSPWRAVPEAGLTVTSGAIGPSGAWLRTRSAEMRAVHRDGGRHAVRARLRFRLLGDSETTKPLGSGLVRRQIGLKLRAGDPCNLVYVMWRSFPDQAIAVFVKRNAGQTTSAQCGNRGYTDVATTPVPAASRGHGTHVLEARTRRAADGTLALSVSTDGSLLRRQRLGPDLTAGLDGPIGVRSDNGDYVFRLFAGGRPSRR